MTANPVWRKIAGLFVPDMHVVLAVCAAAGVAVAVGHVPGLAWARPWMPLWLLTVTVAAFSSSLAGSVRSSRRERRVLR